MQIGQTPAPAPTDMTVALTELTGLILATPRMESLLSEAARLAAQVIKPPVSCGITLRGDPKPYTAASSDSLAAHVAEIQYGHGQGPCLQALDRGEVVYVPDLAAETRWSSYRTGALGYGVRSSLSLPLAVDGQPAGSLNLYAASPDAFGPAEQRRADLFAGQAATALAIVAREVRLAAISDQLRQALASRSVIDQAIGIIIAQRRCDAGAAFDVLRDASQRHNRKLRDIAADVVQCITGCPVHPGRFQDPS